MSVIAETVARHFDMFYIFSCHDLARYQLMEGNTGLMTYRYMKAAQVSECSILNITGT
jgi:hypothetical protein